MERKGLQHRQKQAPALSAPRVRIWRQLVGLPSGSGARAKSAMALIHCTAQGSRAADTGAFSANWKIMRRTLRGRSMSWSLALIFADHAGSKLGFSSIQYDGHSDGGDGGREGTTLGDTLKHSLSVES